MLYTGKENNTLGGKEYIAIENNTLSTLTYELLDSYFDFSPMSEDDAITAIDSVIDNNFKNILSKNKDPIIVMITGGIDTILGFSYLKKYTDNYKILTYEHIDFTDFICKNWALFKKRNSSEGFLHFNGSNLILAGGWGDERLLRDPRICNLNFKLHNSSILSEIEQHSGEYQYLISQTPAYKAGYLEQDSYPIMNEIELNDTFVTANQVQAVVAISSYVTTSGDIDVYELSIPGSGRTNFQFSPSTGSVSQYSYDYDIKIYNLTSFLQAI
jgi:hypothetical protein